MRLLNEREPGAELPAWRRVILAMSMFLCVAAFGFLEPFVPLYLEQSGLRRAEIGLVSGMGPALALLIQPLLGRLSDRIDARRPLMIGAALAAGCAYMTYRSANGLGLFLALTAVGVNGVMYLNTANAVLVGRIASCQGNGAQCGKTFASYRIWGSIGYVVISLLTGLLLSRSLHAHAVSRATLSPVFQFGPLLFFAVAGVACLVPDLKKPQPCPDPVSGATGAPDEAARVACESNLRRFLRSYFLYIFAYTGCGAYLSLYLRSMGATPMWITGVFATGVLCEVLVMSQVGRLSDRFGRRPLLAVSFLAMPVRLLLYAAAASPLWVMGVQTLHGVNFGVMVAVAAAFINDVCTEENRGAAQARMAATGGLASALGPATGGFLAQRLGLPWTFGIMACFAAAGAGLFLWTVRESLPHPVRLYRRGPACLRPALHLLCVPLGWLSRLPRLRRRA